MAENKKDSFTFSDKIKNSKPAFNPFSKRVSSKIGSNGKPKKTLFERTRRDAPFFVAAAAALLMLPFLYKYSGSMNEEVIVPPGSEDSVFDPERYGFNPSNEDPNGQIAQMAGRDPLSLIKGWGSAEPEEEPPMYDADRRDGLDDTYTPPAPTASDSPRAWAPAATRAAFQRTPTKIKELGSASMNLRGGGGGFGRFGGANLKRAASKNSAGAPKQGTKPVSLQPLRAADKPSRSYFGQSSAAQARASRDAMGKADAKTALRDAMFRPVETGRLGGLGTGDFASGGGSGKLDITHDYKGITPWWWDMMKERAQKKWEWKYFLWRKNLVEPLIQRLAEGLGNLGCCIAMGSDDCSADTFFGGGDNLKEPTCCGKKQSKIGALLKAETGLDFGKEACDNYKTKVGSKNCPDGWKDGHSYAKGKGMVGVRFACMGGTWSGGKNAGASMINDRFNCEALDTNHNFEVQTSGKANSWHKYHVIVAKNYVPFDNAGSHYLCGMGNKNANKQSVAAVENAQGAESDIRQKDATKKASSRYAADNYDDLQREGINDACVIYVVEGPALDWKDFKAKTMTLLEQLGLKKNGRAVTGEEAFNALQLYFIDGYAFKHPMSKGGNETRATNNNGKMVKVRNMPVDVLPMAYVDFESYYVLRRKNDSKEDSAKLNDKWRVYDETYKHPADDSTRTVLTGINKKADSVRTACVFASFQIKAQAINSLSSLVADLTFDPKVHGATGGGIKVTLDVPEAGLNGIPVKGAMEGGEDNKTVSTHRFEPNAAQMKALNDALAQNGQITAKWTARRGDKLSQDTADYAGNELFVEQPKETAACKDGETTQFTDEQKCTWTATCKAGVWSDAVKDDPNCGQAGSNGGNGSGSDGQGAVESQPVGFFQGFSSIPASPADRLNADVRKAGEKNTASKQWGQCKIDMAIATKKLSYVDDSVKALLAAAKAKYDAANKENGTYLDYDEANVTIANLLDAMLITEQKAVSKNAVCMLAKSIAVNTKDPSVPSAGNNMFGSFAAFMGNDSSFFPAHWVRKNGVNVRDARFTGCVGRQAQKTKPYHYGHYNWNHHRLGDDSQQNDRAPYEQVLASGMWRQAPLKALAEGKDFRRATSIGQLSSSNDTLDDANRKLYHAAYRDLFQTSGSCNYRNSDTMSIADAMAYIQALCDNGTNLKPENGSKLACGARYRASQFAVGE